MNINLTPTRQAALDREAASRSTQDKLVTADEIAQGLMDSACDSYAATQLAADNAKLAENTSLLAIGQAVNAASPEKQTAIIKAAQDILSAP